ncbi:MAG: hypothetical protein MJZ37_00480 [Bacilli bacterium]|nr:hypothetical protein [Bacilli bacterium]
MTKLDSLMQASLVIGKSNPDIFLSSINLDTDDEFLVVVNDKVEAIIYQYKDSWYIWYTKKCYRTQVSSFTAACEQIEEEIQNCVA